MKEKLAILLLIMAFLCFCVLASTSPSEEILHLDHSQGNNKLIHASTAKVPPVCGGAAMKHNKKHHKHNGSNCNYGCVGLKITFALAMFTSLILWEAMQV
ncbi:hypothetical protein CDL12_00619 [Handroanthus impetiginosus]|uniref:Transmembrane protein n=1 Tax=Handroanthus impetiginosus TaxID=429701 RepID=A0A2G9IA66_9LAMI|nr:hypothetical protein CDL12_00619 [Handroanthus impetiginosus]